MNNLKKIKVLTISTLLLFSGVFFSEAQDYAVKNWNKDKDEVFKLAKEQGKFILLFAGRESCGNCQHTSDVFNDPERPLKQIIDDNYICWYSNTPSSRVYEENAREYIDQILALRPSALPLLSVINPHEPGKNVAILWGKQDVETLKKMLSAYTVSNETIRSENNVTISGNVLYITNRTKNEQIYVFTLSGQHVASFDKKEYHTAFNASHFPKGILVIHSSTGWSVKIINQ
ncbi:MAG: thioredoxin family protein [Tannerella sp.]|jgi:hypothetical protein|nr:thioredoxin family protein [Tannerella sp.]